MDTSSTNSLSKFKDNSFISNYAEEAMKWAVSKKIIQGDEKNQLNPRKSVSRAETAAIIQRFMQAY